MTVQDLKRRLAGEAPPFVLDVREPEELVEGEVPGATMIPMDSLPGHIGEIPLDRTVAVLCRSGVRSASVTEYLKQLGFNDVHNIEGGIRAWNKLGCASAIDDNRT